MKNFFLLGAGFTRSLCPVAPLNDDLVASLGKCNASGVTMRYANSFDTQDIEHLLTMLDLRTSEAKRTGNECALRELEDDRCRIDSEISEFFEKFRFGRQCDVLGRNPWFRMFASKILEPNDVLATLNYDCLLEGILDQLEIWAPSEGAYGRRILSTLEALNVGPLHSCKVKILKLHGSEHFRFRANGANPNGGQRTIAHFVNRDIYPRSGNGNNFGSTFNQLTRGHGLVAPSFVKALSWELESTTLEAISLAKRARNLVVIGSVIRPEDSHINLIIKSFLFRQSRRSSGKFIIVGPHASDLERRLRENWFGEINRLYSIEKGFECAVGDLCRHLSET